MNKIKDVRLTVSEFADLHGVNKRTLHYYDNIGLFSPNFKSDKGYRYYSHTQSLEFEYIIILKKLGMSIDEIKLYINDPSEEGFIEMAQRKIDDINKEIKNLEKTREALNFKKEQLKKIPKEDRLIEVVNFGGEIYSIAEFVGDLSDDDYLEASYKIIKESWSIDQYTKGIGSYISVEKLKKYDFENYDGIFIYSNQMIDQVEDQAVRDYGVKNSTSKKANEVTNRDLSENHKKNKYIKLKPGKYIRAYQRGGWDKIPDLYKAILKFINENNIEIEGMSYEMGMNDFIKSGPKDNVVQILIKIREA